MRDRPGDPVLAEEQRMLPPTTGACSFGGRGYPSWCAEQAVKLPEGFPRRLGARAGSELLWVILPYQHTDLYRIVSLRWPTGSSWSCWVVATAGQSYGLANSSAKTSGRAVARRLKRRRDDAGQTTSTWLESERITARRENR